MNTNEVTSTSAKEIVASLYEAFGQGDLPTVLGMFDSSISWHEAEGSPYQPTGNGWIGPDAVVSNLFEKLGEDWSEFVVNPSLYHDSGSVVTVEGRYNGNHQSSGMNLNAQFCHVWTLRDGKVIKFQQYTDTAQLQNVMNG